jgi:ketosteroid isomerase-like protein
MSQEENVEIVRRLAEAHNAGGFEAMLPFLAEDVLWHPLPEWIEESEYRGHEGVRKLMSIFTDNFDDYAISVKEIKPVGDRVVLLAEQVGRIKGSGDLLSQPMGCVISDFRGGQIGETHFFRSWREALQAAGLRG